MLHIKNYLVTFRLSNSSYKKLIETFIKYIHQIISFYEISLFKYFTHHIIISWLKL